MRSRRSSPRFQRPSRGIDRQAADESSGNKEQGITFVRSRGFTLPGMGSRMMEQQSVPILIAVEDPADRKVLGKALADAGYRKVVTVADGRKAVAAMAGEFFPIVIAGPRLSGMDGFELCRTLRARNLPGYVYILMLTRGEPEVRNPQGARGRGRRATWPGLSIRPILPPDSRPPGGSSISSGRCGSRTKRCAPCPSGIPSRGSSTGCTSRSVSTRSSNAPSATGTRCRSSCATSTTSRTSTTSTGTGPAIRS